MPTWAKLSTFQMDKSFCRQQAKLVRALADQADPFIKRRLLQLAEHYERRLTISDSKKSGVQEYHDDDLICRSSNATGRLESTTDESGVRRSYSQVIPTARA